MKKSVSGEIFVIDIVTSHNGGYMHIILGDLLFITVFVIGCNGNQPVYQSYTTIPSYLNRNKVYPHAQQGHFPYPHRYLLVMEVNSI